MLDHFTRYWTSYYISDHLLATGLLTRYWLTYKILDHFTRCGTRYGTTYYIWDTYYILDLLLDIGLLLLDIGQFIRYWTIYYILDHLLDIGPLTRRALHEVQNKGPCHDCHDPHILSKCQMSPSLFITTSNITVTF